MSECERCSSKADSAATISATSFCGYENSSLNAILPEIFYPIKFSAVSPKPNLIFFPFHEAELREKRAESGEVKWSFIEIDSFNR